MTRNYSSTAATTTLSAPINDTQTSMIVAATTGFPAAPFALTVDTGGVSQEAVLVTSVAGTTLTVTRGYDSTSAQAHLAGAVVTHSHLAIDFRDAATHQGASTGVHGVTGAVVGTTDTQTLTNKTLGSTNTLNGFTASKMAVTDGTGKLVAGTSAVPAGAVVGTSDTQTLTNKTIALGSNTISGTLAQLSAAVTDDDVTGTTAFNAHTAATATHGATGAVVGTTNTQTLTNKTLSTGTLVGGATTDISGAWTAYTPTLTNFTLGNGVMTAKYVQIGKTVNFYVNIVFGTTSTFSASSWTLTLPTSVATAGEFRFPVGMKDSSASSNYLGTTFSISGSTVFLGTTGGASGLLPSGVSSTAPFTWATSDTLTINGTYEAA